MPFLKVQDTITITASGGSFTLDTTASTELYNIIGVATMISNVTIAPLGTPITGLTYVFNYKAILDITTNSTSITIFGQTLTAAQALNSQEIICSYNGTSWDVDIQSSFDNSNIVSTSNIQNNAITASKIAPGTITTFNLADNSIPNDKLATMTPSSIKIGGSTGDPADLALGLDEIAIGDGTTVIAVNKNTAFPVLDESFKTVGSSGNMANGQPIPTLATDTTSPLASVYPNLKLRKKGNGQTEVIGSFGLTSFSGTSKEIFTLPVGYKDLEQYVFPIKANDTTNGDIIDLFVVCNYNVGLQPRKVYITANPPGYSGSWSLGTIDISSFINIIFT